MFKRNRILILAAVALAILFVFFRLSPKSSAVLGEVPPAKNGQKILVVAAHPDDETVGAGGFIYDAVKNGATVKVVIVTNGDANFVSESLANKGAIFNSKDYINQGKTRMQESKKALAQAGVEAKNIYFLSFPDRGLRNLLARNFTRPETSIYTGLTSSTYPGSYKIGAPYTGAQLTSELGEIIARFGPDLIITHSPLDNYSDHRSVYEFVQKSVTKIPVYTFVVHFRGLEFPSPFLFRPAAKLAPPQSLLKKCNWRTYPLAQNTENSKYKGINNYVSQLHDPALYLLLRAFVRTNELFCVNP